MMKMLTANIDNIFFSELDILQMLLHLITTQRSYLNTFEVLTL